MITGNSGIDSARSRKASFVISSTPAVSCENICLASSVNLKTSSSLVRLEKCLGGSEWEAPSNIQQTSDSGYIIAGDTDSTDGDVAGNHGSSDNWIVKLDKSGNIEWKKCIGGSNTDTANHIQQTSDGGYIVAGETYSTNGDVTGNHGDRDYWIVKLKKEGANT